MVDLRGARGCEQGKVRPAIVVSNNINNRLSPTVTVVPITTADKKPWQGTHADLGDLDFLDIHSMALAEQLTTVDKACILKWLGHLEDYRMWRVEHAMRVQLYAGTENFYLTCS